MRILHIAHEFPLPTFHGGRLDIWQHICGFNELGFESFHISWSDSKVDQKSLQKINDKVTDLILLQKPEGLMHQLFRFVNLFNLPSLAFDRKIKNDLFLQILSKVKVFKPDLIFLDVIYGGDLAIRLKQELEIPLVLRSQNVEHTYIAEQFKRAKGIKLKLSLWMAMQGLRIFEYRIFNSADLIADISEVDLLFWQGEGFKNLAWLPPIYVPDQLNDITSDVKSYDIVFFGNLNTPNNIDGVIWFLQDILPIIEQSLNVDILIMGSNPSKEIVEITNGLKNVELIPNVENPNKYINKAKLLINPVRFGSGVKMKTIEILFSDKQYVTTTDGIKGLPSELFKDIFFVSDTEVKFAWDIVSILKFNNSKSLEERKIMRPLFSVESLKKVLFSEKFK
jgi:hypothetical protein